ncbi:Inner membrane lipoprotein YiaD precursor [Salinivirga cyanobacteriivorans]|uniref:Inner membrane lipoprotein YiaD n=2 Tax=Salinivirga cyanobacteriivorans TaxID=1307839 RepID=A0A0S2HWH5_9BACT|nr:Inner membrane lipoprotein YiaD precursor [Salinivirga cyanobacteriivorans]
MPLLATGQFSFLDDPYGDIQLEFLRDKIETKKAESFFNVLKIKNPTDRRLQFNAHLTLPRGWGLMVDARQTITLNPKDSVLLPIRASISPNAKGEIGYAVVATLTDNKGKSFKNEYSFVNIPKTNKIKFRPAQRTLYFNNATNKAKMEFNCINQGNVDEVVYLEFNYDKGIGMPNGANQSYKTEFLLSPNTDTTLSFDMKYLNQSNETYGDRKNYRVHIKTYTRDTAFENALWIKKINQEYENYIPDRNRLLIVELSALNIFSDYDPIYNADLRGSFLTKKAGSVFYRFQTMGKRFYEDPWLYSRIRVRYDYKNLLLKLGDVNESIDQSLFGRGASAHITYKKQELKLTATRNLFNKADQAGALLRIKPYGESYVEAGGIYATNADLKQDNYLGVFGFFVPFFNNVRFYIRGGISETYFTDFGNKSVMGYGSQANISYNSKKINFRSTFQYGDRHYKGYFAGRLKSYNQANIGITKRMRLTVTGNLFYNNPPVYDGYKLQEDLYFNSLYSLAQLNYNLNPTFTLYGGPRHELKWSNNFFNFDRTSELSVPTTYLTAGVRIRSQNTTVTANLKGAAGYTYSSVDRFAVSNPILKKNHRYPSFELGVNLRGRIWSIYASYYDGPYTLNQHYENIYFNIDNRLVRILPQIGFFVYKDYIKIENRSTLNFDLASKSTRYNINTIVSGYPGKGWRLQLINTIGYQSSYDEVVEEKYTFSNTYFEFRVQKKFGFNQPRVQYHDLRLIFFKDLNGDGKKSKDEPGIENVLAKINVDHTVNDSMQQIGNMNEGGFYATELLSDIKGLVKYDNIPGGFYTVNYVSLGKMQGNYTSDKSQQKFIMDDDKTIYIPYKENNKIFGSVILNRSKLSNLGNISPANVKITATDSKGNVYSTLTDKNGDFILYVPNVDKYKIHMNNIFYEHFNLAQNDFTVELNGYKQFEINFILNEKRRRISFSNNLDFAEQDRNVRVIRRTNLGGSVKDAATFKPIKAEVKIIDSETGEVVSEARTDGKTGKFYVSFLAGENYKLVVTSDGYWFYAENLPSGQITTFQNMKREIMLDYITVGSKVNLQAITFEPDSDQLSPESMAELDRLAGILKDNPGIELEVVGHCDDIEAIENIEVAEERARTVTSYLMKQGIKNIKFSSAGNSQPVSAGNTEEERAKNRRVEAIVISK